MAKRFTAGFRDDLGLEYNIDFYDSDYSGSSVGTLTLGTPGFEMDWDGRSQNTHEPILASACSIPIYVSTASEQTFVSDVQTGQEGRFRVEVFRGPSASQQLFWSGVLFCDITLQDEDPQLVTLEATDDLGLLDEVLYKDSLTAEYTDTTHLITVFCRILSKVRHIDAWASDKNFLYVSDHVQHDDMASAPYTRKIIINHTKLRNVNDNGEAEFFTCKEVLVAMLTNLQARIMQYHGAWWIIPVAKSNAGMTAYAYFKNGDNANNSTSNTPSFVTQTSGNLYALSTAITSSNKTKLAGFEFGSLPSLSEVNYKHNYNGSAADFNGLDYTGVSNIANPTVTQMLPVNGDVVLEDDDVVTLTFSYVVQIAGYGTNVSSDRGRRAKFSFRYNHGDICARRNVSAMLDGNSDVVTNTYTTSGGNMECFVVNETAPIYDTTSTNEVQVFTGVFDRFVGGYLSGTVSITFPAIDVDLGTVALPTIGFLNVKIFDKTGTDVTSSDPGLPGNFDAFSYISDIYQMRGSAILDGDEITYTRTNAAATARESLNLPPAILADRVGTSNPNQGVWLVNDDGNFVQATPNWSSSTFSSVSTPICDLTCLDIVSLRQTPLSVANGTIRFPNNLYGPCFAVQGLDSDTAYYVPMRLRLIANNSLYEGEWFKYQYDSSTATTASDDSVPIPTASAEFVRGLRRQRLTLNTLQQTMSEATSRLTGEIQGASQQIADNSVSFEARAPKSVGNTNVFDGQIVEYVIRTAAYANATHEGQVLKFGNDTLVQGKMYVYGSGGWASVDADAEATTRGLFGLALGTNSGTDGLLIRGVAYNTGYSYSAGDILYISTTQGALSATKPSASGDFVRVIGYALGSNYIVIDPSPNYIEL
jgi:hypothetical protein